MSVISHLLFALSFSLSDCSFLKKKNFYSVFILFLSFGILTAEEKDGKQGEKGEGQSDEKGN